VVVTKGGLNARHPQTGATIVIAAAAVEAFLPPQTGVYRPA
jgi:nucleoid DNA-binding protein